MALSSSSSPPPEDLEWEEWDSRTSPLSFPHHCLAGSFAGVAEHTLLYPLDTVKTCWQSQVLHRASSAASAAAGARAVGGGGAASATAGCASSGSCGIFTMGHVQNIVMPGSGSAAGVGGIDGGTLANKSSLHSNPQTSTNNITATTSNSVSSHSSKSQHGIWSTMKHLVQQGHHHNHPTQQHHPINQTLITLAGNPPNVVDLTTTSTKTASSYHHSTNTSTASTSSSSSSSKQQIIKRPWSKHGRILRNATLQDITAQGMIRASSSSVGAGAAILSSSGFITSNTSTTITNSTTANAATNNTAGIKRLWRGVQSMFVGCIPAHALYFSSYELIKSVCTDGGGAHHAHHHHVQHHSHGDSSRYDLMGDDNMSMTQQLQQQHQHEQGHVGHDTLSPTQAMLAGGIATLLHDFVMTPMDTMKQRMQLGHYDNLRHAFVSIVWGEGGSCNSRGYGAFSVGGGVGVGSGEGWRGLYRSFPITVMTNVPYGMIMMTTNEWLRGVLEDGLYGRHHEEDNEETNPFHFTTILLSGMGAGGIASAITAPLDRVKTRLQTQRMGMVLPSHHYTAASSNPTTASRATTLAIMEERVLAAAQGNPKVCPKMAVQDVKSTLFPSSAAVAASSSTTSSASIPLPRQPLMATATTTPFQTYYSTPFEAFQSIVQEEGLRGLFRGTLPRVALHAPSVAISWTAYEMAKEWLIWSQQ
ncbi:hypothetical protein ACHAXH_003285 [Discostella pseudostelligera]|jgi:hypothetical protein